jgi:hypothetical protein
MALANNGILDGLRRIGAKVRDLVIDGGLPGAPLGYRLRGATQAGAPQTGTWKAGDQVPDRNAAVWICTAGGTGPGASWAAAGSVSPALTGTPTAPTAAPLNSSTQIATTAYTDAAVTAGGGGAPLASPAFTGTPTAPTRTALTSNTGIATTAYTDSAVGVETTRAEAAEVNAAKIGGQAAYANYVATNPTLALTTAWAITTSLPSVTLPNDGNTYRVEFTCPSIALSVTGVVFLGLGSSASVFYAAASINVGGTRWGEVSMVAQKVTGAGQTLSVYAKVLSGTPTVTFYASDTSPNGAEMAAYRVA